MTCDSSCRMLLAYVLSFIYLGIYWNNHHHMMPPSHRVTGGALWANLHLLFWLSLTHFVQHGLDEREQLPHDSGGVLRNDPAGLRHCVLHPAERAAQS